MSIRKNNTSKKNKNIFQQFWNITIKNDEKDYLRGYNFGAGSLLSGKCNIENLENLLECSKTFNEYNKFDLGIDQAIRDYSFLLNHGNLECNFNKQSSVKKSNISNNNKSISFKQLKYLLSEIDCAGADCCGCSFAENCKLDTIDINFHDKIIIKLFDD